MRIHRKLLETMDIENFAEKHDLVLVVVEKYNNGEKTYSALFENANHTDRTAKNNGKTIAYSEDEAIYNFARAVSDDRIITARNGISKYIDTPILVYKKWQDKQKDVKTISDGSAQSPHPSTNPEDAVDWTKVRQLTAQLVEATRSLQNSTYIRMRHHVEIRGTLLVLTVDRSLTS